MESASAYRKTTGATASQLHSGWLVVYTGVYNGLDGQLKEVCRAAFVNAELKVVWDMIAE